ncbi:recombinase B [Leptolyngbya sp. 'hensonii']|uniref:TM0106 family RecB-like putative nuclease n=1 Tax=Leptolyngbya sp. 'hensonii' TaxID=1922337 RepID=UPI00094F70C9|nr:TM0106 family RecB-like putative nuclease [Leptolyngbya sp. 'hensonii']OLP17083.1 recombinase B [Leptolyngbya sp. 'hensonii']
MFLTAELLLYFQRCSRRAYLDTFGDLSQRDPPSAYLLKLIQDSATHRRSSLRDRSWQQPTFAENDWQGGMAATLDLMQQGVDCINRGVLLTQISEEVTLLSRPDLLVKHSGQSQFGDWLYVPTEIKLGKRPKLEYQIVAAFNVKVLAAVQEAWPEHSWLLLREKGAYEVDLWKILPDMEKILQDCIQTLNQPEAPEVFIARNRCSLCHWYSHCYDIAQSQQHLSLLPGVTASRYIQLQAQNLTTVESLAYRSSDGLANLPGFNPEVAQKLVLQAQSTLQNRAILRETGLLSSLQELPTADIELYFDIEAEPELNLAYLHGVLVVDRQTGTETFYSLLAEQPDAEIIAWQQFLELVWRYPNAPIFHFCPYEVQTVERLGKLYNTPSSLIEPLVSRFIDLHEWVTQTVILPVESYALKPIARWLGFDWRDPNANGALAICWYTEWLEQGDRASLEAIIQYNEDDCRAMQRLKDWLVEFTQRNSREPITAEPITAEPIARAG